MPKTPKLGQHFLRDSRALQRIASSLDIDSGDIVVEIGPGRGALTKHLITQNPSKLIVIEKDTKLAQDLPETLGNPSNLEVLEGDILKELPKISTPYKLVGNIPYYLTGHLLRLIGDLESKPQVIVFTVQKEVAERLCSSAPKMNLLAASVDFWSSPKILRYISKNSFNPPPKVDSAIIKLSPQSEYKNINPKIYYKILKILFSQPRKTITNNLSAGLNKDKKEIESQLVQINIDPKLRPQHLNIEDIIDLTSKLGTT